MSVLKMPKKHIELLVIFYHKVQEEYGRTTWFEMAKELAKDMAEGCHNRFLDMFQLEVHYHDTAIHTYYWGYANFKVRQHYKKN